ncbi:MAG: hypothetical protein ABI823_10675 [Bryobacteraceae bacterium]
MRIFLLTLTLGALLTAADKPNYSGTWRLNVAASDFSQSAGKRDPTLQLPAPESMTRMIEQKGDHLKYRVERTLGGKKYEFDVDLTIGSGEPFSSNPAGIVTAEWSGDALTVATLYNPNRARSERTEKWSLSADGKTLIDEMAFRSPEGVETKVRRVFEKQ